MCEKYARSRGDNAGNTQEHRFRVPKKEQYGMTKKRKTYSRPELKPPSQES